MNKRFLVIGALATLVPLAGACAGVWDPGLSSPVAVAEETALISWNPATQTEHFIRRASFQTEASRMGFLVPTPSKPWLTAFDESIFDSLHEATHPIQYDRATGYKFVFWRSEDADAAAGGVTGAKAAGGVDVVSVQDVAGYKAVILRATDTTALAKWLASNGFAMRPALSKWLDVYVKQGWYLTAFTFKEENALDITSPLVRISFKTSTPIYPYREPDDAKSSSGRSLRVYFISNVPSEAKLDGKKWGAKLESSQYIDPDIREKLVGNKKLPLNDVTGYSTLTTFLDKSTSRIGAGEVKFYASKTGALMPPTPTIIKVDDRREVPITIWFPVGLIAIMGLSFGVIGFRRMWHKEEGLEGSA